MDTKNPEVISSVDAMNNAPGTNQDDAYTRSLLDQLLEDSRLYHKSSEYQKLLDFVSNMPNMAPFNAMLLQIQKPGIRFAAGAAEWQQHFGRAPKRYARPLLIMWPFGPVALVYDVMDTEGNELPVDVAAFYAKGTVDDAAMLMFRRLVEGKGIRWINVDAGDNQAGSISVKMVKQRQSNGEERQVFSNYELAINQNHSAAVRFATLVHELGHLCLGHLGENKALKINGRQGLTEVQRELEAESVSYIVCSRHGVESRAHVYLSGYLAKNENVEGLDVYQVMKAAGAIETWLKITCAAKSKSSLLGRTGDLFD